MRVGHFDGGMGDGRAATEKGQRCPSYDFRAGTIMELQQGAALDYFGAMSGIQAQILWQQQEMQLQAMAYRMAHLRTAVHP